MKMQVRSNLNYKNIEFKREREREKDIGGILK